MNKQGKIDKIYKEIANKELSFGCKVNYKNRNVFKITKEDPEYIRNSGRILYKTGIIDSEIKEFKILSGNTIHIINERNIIRNFGHPVIIGDVLACIELQGQLEASKYDGEGAEQCYFDMIHKPTKKITQIWRDKRKPIEEQSEECIDYIFKLL